MSSLWMKHLDDNNIVIEWIEPWVKEAEGSGWEPMTPEVRAVVCAWLLNVYSLRGGAISFLWYAPPWILEETAAGLRLLSQGHLASLWESAILGVEYQTTTEQDALEFSDDDDGDEIDSEILNEMFGERLLGWLREHADALPSPPNWDIYANTPTSPGAALQDGGKSFGRSMVSAPGGFFVAGIQGSTPSLVVDRFTLNERPGRTERQTFRLRREGVGDIVTTIELAPEGSHVVLLNQSGEVLMLDLTGTPPHGPSVVGRLPKLFVHRLCVSSSGLVGWGNLHGNNEALLFSMLWSGELRAAPCEYIDSMILVGDRYLYTNKDRTRCVELGGKELWQITERIEHWCGALPGSGELSVLGGRGLRSLDIESGALRAVQSPLTELPSIRHIYEIALSADGKYLAAVAPGELWVWSLMTGAGRVFPIRQPIYEMAFVGSVLSLVGNRSLVLSVDLADPESQRLRYQPLEGWDYCGWNYLC